MKDYINRTLSLFILQFGLALASLSGGQGDRIVLVVNSNDPDSMKIAEHYAKARDVPAKNIIELETSTEETITLKEYVETIHNPLITALVKDEWIAGVKSAERDRYGRICMSVAISGIDYLVTTRGVPLRIANDPEQFAPSEAQIVQQFRVNQASVDSELALVACAPGTTMTAFLKSPLFGQLNPSGLDVSRVVRVSRLDGPSLTAVTRLIDRSLEAEANGLMGRAYIDTGGPHKSGDQWIREAGDLAKAAYFETDFETTKQLMDDRSRLDAPAIYMGWYKQHAVGPWREKSWSVPPGAIGFHLHSFSATTVRSKTRGWVGPFVNQGYCATVGNVYEPYLEFTHRPQGLLARLLDGATFGEAVAFANPVLSWQTVAIGDPLYRPFKVDLATQLKRGEEGPFSSYVILREINRLLEKEGEAAALDYARVQFVKNPSLALSYRLGLMYSNAGDSKRVGDALKVVRYMDRFSRDEIVLVQKIANLLSKNGHDGLAFELSKKLIDYPKLHKNLRIQLLEGGAKIARKQNELIVSSQWELEAVKLKAPPEAK